MGLNAISARVLFVTVVVTFSISSIFNTANADITTVVWSGKDFEYTATIDNDLVLAFYSQDIAIGGNQSRALGGRSFGNYASPVTGIMLFNGVTTHQNGNWLGEQYNIGGTYFNEIATVTLDNAYIGVQMIAYGYGQPIGNPGDYRIPGTWDVTHASYVSGYFNGVTLHPTTVTIYDGARPPAPTGIPEPTTWAMLILGIGLVSVAIRLQRIHRRACHSVVSEGNAAKLQGMDTRSGKSSPS